MGFGRSVYGLLVGLHPADFRRNFGPEMELDFDEAATKDGFYWDAIVSLGRQCGRSGFAVEERRLVAGRALLDGCYGVVGGDPLNLFEFGRGSVLALALFGGLVFANGHAAKGLAGLTSAAVGYGEQTGRLVKKPEAGALGSEERTHAQSSARPKWPVDETGQPQAQLQQGQHKLPVRMGMVLDEGKAERAEAQRRTTVTIQGAASVRGGPTHVGIMPRHEWGTVGEAVSGRQLAFEVVSIRENKSSPMPGQGHRDFGPTANGYHLGGLPMLFVIRTAYLPTKGGDVASYSMKQLAGLPDWVKSTEYDIDAKVSEADVADWRDPALQPEMLRAMLQTMLADRLKLVVHREMREASIFELTVGRSGPKFKPAEATTLDEIRRKHPGAFAGPEGTIAAQGATPGELTYFNITVAGVAALFSNMAGRPIEDKTGLTGKYDITYRMEQSGPDGEPRDQVSQMADMMSQLGLKLQPAKGQVETLVIEHVEKPTEN